MKRKLFSKLLAHLPRKDFTIIIGARQTGKTTLLEQLQQELSVLGETAYFFTL